MQIYFQAILFLPYLIPSYLIVTLCWAFFVYILLKKKLLVKEIL